MYELMPALAYIILHCSLTQIAWVGFRVFSVCLQAHICWHFSLTFRLRCSHFSSQVSEIYGLHPAEKIFLSSSGTLSLSFLSFFPVVQSGANHHLLPSYTETDIKPHINFSFISEHNSIPLPLFQSLTPSFLHSANSPDDSALEILMCSVRCWCLECCPDHELCFWTERKAKQPFRGSGRGPYSWV